MTRCGTWVPPGPSRKAAGCPLTVCCNAGNWERTQSMSKRVTLSFSLSVVSMGIVLVRRHSAYEVRQHAISGGVQSGIDFREDESGKHVRLKIHDGRGSRDRGQWVAGRQLLGTNAGDNALSFPTGAAHKFVRRSRLPGCAD